MDKPLKKRILIFAHYYAPDVASTGQILQDQAEGMTGEFDVTVICAVPSYTGTISEEYKEKKFYKEEINGVHILRVPLPEFTKSSKKSRIRNLLAYFFQAMKAVRIVGPQDYVFTISQPPIMGGMLGVYGKNKLRTADGAHPKLIYCIQDFNPEQIEAVGYIKSKPILRFVKWLDKRSCQKSDLVIMTGRDLEETLKRRFAKETLPEHIVINNWIDEKKVYPLESDTPEVAEFKKAYKLDDKFVIMYSGNIGLYYDLEGIMKVIEKFGKARTLDGKEVVFVFVGAGSALDELVWYKNEHNMDNVIFIPYQDKDKLIFSLNAADVHWCVNAKGIKGVSCPSKFYGIVGVGKPVLGVLENGSEIEMLIREIGCGRCSEPGEYDKVEENIRWFIDKAGSNEVDQMGKKGHRYLVKNLTKEVSIGKYIKAIRRL